MTDGRATRQPWGSWSRRFSAAGALVLTVVTPVPAFPAVAVVPVVAGIETAAAASASASIAAAAGRAVDQRRRHHPPEGVEAGVEQDGDEDEKQDEHGRPSRGAGHGIDTGDWGLTAQRSPVNTLGVPSSVSISGCVRVRRFTPPCADGRLAPVGKPPRGLVCGMPPRPPAASHRERAPHRAPPRIGAGTRRVTGPAVPAHAPRHENAAKRDAPQAGSDLPPAASHASHTRRYTCTR